MNLAVVRADDGIEIVRIQVARAVARVELDMVLIDERSRALRTCAKSVHGTGCIARERIVEQIEGFSSRFCRAGLIDGRRGEAASGALRYFARQEFACCQHGWHSCKHRLTDVALTSETLR